MFGLTSGELGLVVFITGAIVTARYFPELGERVARLLWKAPKLPNPRK